MKRRDLLRAIEKSAVESGKTFTLREGGAHTKVTVGKTSLSIPRHREIAHGTARNIVRALEGDLGRGWLEL